MKFIGAVDDCAALGGLDHRGNGVFRQQEHGFDIDPRHPPIFLGLLIDDAAPMPTLLSRKSRSVATIKIGLLFREVADRSGRFRGDRLDSCEFFSDLPLCRLNVVISLKVQPEFG